MTELQKLEQQVAELQATIERMKIPEFTYPMWFKAVGSNLTIKFTSLHDGTVVVPNPEPTSWKVGDSYGSINGHTCTEIWTQVPEPIKQWQPQGGEWFVHPTGIVYVGDSDNESKLHGTEYQTKQQAEWARDHMRRFNRLLAYVAEFDVDENGVQWVPDWEDRNKDKYTISYNHSNNRWNYEAWCAKQDTTVHMSKQCAKGLVDKLNDGSVVL